MPIKTPQTPHQEERKASDLGWATSLLLLKQLGNVFCDMSSIVRNHQATPDSRYIACLESILEISKKAVSDGYVGQALTTQLIDAITQQISRQPGNFFRPNGLTRRLHDIVQSFKIADRQKSFCKIAASYDRKSTMQDHECISDCEIVHEEIIYHYLKVTQPQLRKLSDSIIDWKDPKQISRLKLASNAKRRINKAIFVRAAVDTNLDTLQTINEALSKYQNMQKNWLGCKDDMIEPLLRCKLRILSSHMQQLIKKYQSVMQSLFLRQIQQTHPDAHNLIAFCHQSKTKPTLQAFVFTFHNDHDEKYSKHFPNHLFFDTYVPAIRRLLEQMSFYTEDRIRGQFAQQLGKKAVNTLVFCLYQHFCERLTKNSGELSSGFLLTLESMFLPCMLQLQEGKDCDPNTLKKEDFFEAYKLIVEHYPLYLTSKPCDALLSLLAIFCYYKAPGAGYEKRLLLQQGTPIVSANFVSDYNTYLHAHDPITAVIEPQKFDRYSTPGINKKQVFSIKIRKLLSLLLENKSHSHSTIKLSA